MRTISTLKDLETFGIIPLTGEACGLYLRTLCDVTESGRLLIERAFSVPGLKLPESWNCGSDHNPHVGSIMLHHDLVPFLGIFGLLRQGYARVYTIEHRVDRDRIIRELLDLVKAFERGVPVGGAPDGTVALTIPPELAREIVAKQERLREMEPLGTYCLYDVHTVYGFLADEQDEAIQFESDLVKYGYSFRCYTKAMYGTDRHQHAMSGRTY